MKKYSLEIKWGLLFIGVALLWMVFEKAMGWHGELISKHAIYTNFFAMIAIAFYVFALLAKRKQLGGKMSWKEGFIAGLIITIVVTLLSPISQWLTHAVISPEYFPNVIKYAVESGNSTQEAAASYFNLRSYVMQATISALIMGGVTSAIVAIFVRKE